MYGNSRCSVGEISLQPLKLTSATYNVAHDAVFSCVFTHRLRFTGNVFTADNDTLSQILSEDSQSYSNIAVFVDANFARTRPNLNRQVNGYFKKYLPENLPRIHVVPGGEQIKNTQQDFQRILDILERSRLCRKSFVIAVGGGAVLDAVGFAAAITHRGLRLIRIATTTLSQADSAMAVKNGINAFGKKNYIGVFTTPWAIINDESTLDTLTTDNWLAGFSEAIKVALLKDPLLFEYIHRNCDGVRRRNLDVSIPIIRRSGRLHFDHITQSGDPFERADARPLDFGHWSAHKLEQMSGFELSHGQAVAIGSAIDATYANFMGWLCDADHQRILECLSGIGFQLYHRVMQQANTLLGGLDEFQEHLGGRLTIPSISRIGETFDIFEIDTNKMLAAISYLERFHKWGTDEDKTNS
ncbi:MAG: 3-dehydroquinate synthase [Phycisphaerales bacterium]|nr:MAG: 3-dehydroquinate synthase [Phycisphaerales bacterium]